MGSFLSENRKSLGKKTKISLCRGVLTEGGDSGLTAVKGGGCNLKRPVKFTSLWKIYEGVRKMWVINDLIFFYPFWVMGLLAKSGPPAKKVATTHRNCR